MREIKFRAYIKHSARMATVLELNTENGSVFTDGYKYGLSHDDVELMQYTGLTDKNGVDIYEGDVVFFEDGDDFEDDFVISMSENGCFIAHNPKDKSDFYYLDDQDYKVIGNIHQHSELIK